MFIFVIIVNNLRVKNSGSSQQWLISFTTINLWRIEEISHCLIATSATIFSEIYLLRSLKFIFISAATCQKIVRINTRCRVFWIVCCLYKILCAYSENTCISAFDLIPPQSALICFFFLRILLLLLIPLFICVNLFQNLGILILKNLKYFI